MTMAKLSQRSIENIMVCDSVIIEQSTCTKWYFAKAVKNGHFAYLSDKHGPALYRVPSEAVRQVVKIRPMIGIAHEPTKTEIRFK